MQWLFLTVLVAALATTVHGDCAADHSTLELYPCEDTTCEGYLAYNPSECTAASKCPAVVVIQDWNGMNDYEMERARLLADQGYVGFSADIYGQEITESWEREGGIPDFIVASNMHRQDPALYMSKIHAALDKVKSYDFVDTSKIAVIGYCFGGTGVVNMALLGEDVLGVAGYHAGLSFDFLTWQGNTTMEITAKVLLHMGVADTANPNDVVAQLEGEFEAAGATYEIVRYGSGTGHGFTEWSLGSYDARAEYRAWESTTLFLEEVFNGLPTATRCERGATDGCDGICGANTECTDGMCVAACQAAAHACCDLGTTCDDAALRQCVGRFDPFCETDGWDHQCKEEASAACGLVC